MMFRISFVTEEFLCINQLKQVKQKLEFEKKMKFKIIVFTFIFVLMYSLKFASIILCPLQIKRSSALCKAS